MAVLLVAAHNLKIIDCQLSQDNRRMSGQKYLGGRLMVRGFQMPEKSRYSMRLKAVLDLIDKSDGSLRAGVILEGGDKKPCRPEAKPSKR